MEDAQAKVQKELEFLTSKLKGLRYFIAGGVIRDILQNERYKDIDMYFPSKKYGLDVEKRLRDKGARVIVKNNYLCSLQLASEVIVQLIYGRPIESLNQFAKEFDFTVCCAAIDSHGTFVFHSSFFRDLKTKSLVLCNIQSVMGTLERVIRFSKRGYKIDENQLLELALKINDEEPEDLKQDWYDECTGGS